MPDDYVKTTGRRKTSIARVMVKSGSGTLTINGKSPDEYFPTKSHVIMIHQPLEATDNVKKWDIKVKVKGGGFSGQAGAIRHGLARALVQFKAGPR